MQQNIGELYGGCCQEHKLSGENDEGEKDLMLIAEKLSKIIFANKAMPKKVDSRMASAIAGDLWKAVEEGFGKEIVAIDYDSPDGVAIRHLQNNVYQFSSAKNWQQMKQLTAALLDDDNKIRTWSEYRKAAYEINSEFVSNWQKAERETAIAGGQMASKWVDIQKNKSHLPLLEFDAVIDGRTSDLCRSLHGVVLPVDDPFWSVYYPPNHFRCRSSVRQRRSANVTDKSAIQYPEKLPEMFKVNLGEKMLVFPQDHPYWTDIPQTTLGIGYPTHAEDIRHWAKENLANVSYNIPSVGDVSFTNNSIKEILHKAHKHQLAKNQLLLNFESVIKNAELVRVSSDVKGNNNVKSWYYLRIMLNGESSYINIREMNDGTKSIYAITDSLK